MQQGGNGDGKEPQRLAVARVEAGHADVVTGDAAPDGMQKWQ